MKFIIEINIDEDLTEDQEYRVSEAVEAHAARIKSTLQRETRSYSGIHVQAEEVEESCGESNVEFFRRVSEDDCHQGGALTQCFALDAVAKQAEAVVEAGIEELTEQFGPHSFISPALWLNAAKDWKEAFDKRKRERADRLAARSRSLD